MMSPCSPPSCPVPNTHTNVIENGNSNKAQVKLKIFSFINNSIVYLHCKLRICMESPGTTCKIVSALLFETSGRMLVVSGAALRARAQGSGSSGAQLQGGGTGPCRLGP